MELFLEIELGIILSLVCLVSLIVLSIWIKEWVEKRKE